MAITFSKACSIVETIYVDIASLKGQRLTDRQTVSYAQKLDSRRFGVAISQLYLYNFLVE